MRLVITDPAADDLEGIIDYISADNPVAARNVANAVEATMSHLCEFPEMGHAGYLPNTRQFVVPGLPY
jgi:plasmid stabilization system protein ParE